MINKQAFKLGILKSAKINWKDLAISSTILSGMGAGIGALMSPKNRGRGALIGGLTGGLFTPSWAISPYTAPLLGAASGYASGGTIRDALAGAGAGLNFLAPKIYWDLALDKNAPDEYISKINNNYNNIMDISGTINGALLGAYSNPENKLMGAGLGGLIGYGVRPTYMGANIALDKLL